jgi:hypothetical protein
MTAAPTTTDRRHDDDDQPPTPGGAALAAPCVRCRTTAGYVPYDCHRPARKRGLCKYCYDTVRAIMRREGYADMETASRLHPYGRANGGIRKAHEANTTFGWAAAQARVWTRQRIIRDQAGPLIPVAVPTGRPPMRAPLDNAWGGVADPPWRPACWFAPLATEDAAAA